MPETADHRFALKLLGWILGIWLTVLAFLFETAILPAEAAGTVIVLYPPRMSGAESLAASAAAGAKLVSTSAFENVLVVTDPAPGLVGRLQQAGAIGAFRDLRFAGLSFTGCIGASLE